MSGESVDTQLRFENDAARVSDRLIEVLETELPPDLGALADEYERRVGERGRFLWKWIYRLFDAFTLSCVPEHHVETVKRQKTILTMFVTVLDDLADKLGDRATFEQASRVPYTPEAIDVDAEGVDRVVVEFARDLWDHFEDGLDRAPRADEFEDVFSFDLRQVLDSIEYSRVLNDNLTMANLTGSRQYGPNNMVMFPYADVDLMFSPAFDVGEFGDLRSLIWELQRMARIGNWVTTWERELEEGDCSAGVVVHAIEQGIVSVAETDPELLRRRIEAAGIETRFREEWHRRFQTVRSHDRDIDTVDTDRFIEGMRTVMEYHVASQGYK